MSGLLEMRVFPGRVEQVRHARRWVAALALAACAAAADDAGLVAGELVANAVVHTASGAEGGTVTVAITIDGVIHVHDLGLAAGLPCTGLAAGHPGDGRLPESGRGLLLVAALSTSWAHVPATGCPAAGSGGLAARPGWCCTWSRPASWRCPVSPKPRVRKESGA